MMTSCAVWSVHTGVSVGRGCFAWHCVALHWLVCSLVCAHWCRYGCLFFIILQLTLAMRIERLRQCDGATGLHWLLCSFGLCTLVSVGKKKKWSTTLGVPKSSLTSVLTEPVAA